GAQAVPMALDFHLETRAGKTILRLVHSGFGSGGAWDEEYDGTRRGWGYELRSLRHYLERHRGEDRKVAWVRMRVGASPEQAWPLVMGAQGLDATRALNGAREGDAYVVTTALGDTIRGIVKFVNPPHDFAATVADLEDSLLRVQVAEYAGVQEVGIWLSAWGVSSERVAAFEERSERLLRGLFPDAVLLPHVSIRE
ncbi:MAG: SRPBCC family protein, partial [Longimicrobiales bacterium]